MISIIVAYRDRPELLKTFLESLVGNDVQLVLVDLGSTGTAEIIDQYREQLLIDHRWIDYTGLFWKTKALNHVLLHSTGEWVSVVDVDCLFPASFFEGVQARLIDLGNRKLSFHVEHLDERITRQIHLHGVEQARARIIPNLRGCNRLYETFGSFLTGNSHFVMRRGTLLDLGGFDERFRGYGWEDHDLNMRCVSNGIETVMYEPPIHHLWHKHEADWRSTESQLINQSLFAENKKVGWPKLIRSEQWGQFG